MARGRPRGEAAFLEGLAGALQNLPQLLMMRQQMQQQEAEKERREAFEREKFEAAQDAAEAAARDRRLARIDAQGRGVDQTALQMAQIIQGAGKRGFTDEQLGPLGQAAAAQQQLTLPSVGGGMQPFLNVAKPDAPAFAQALANLPGLSQAEMGIQALDEERTRAAIDASNALTALREAELEQVGVTEPEAQEPPSGADLGRALNEAQEELINTIQAEMPNVPLDEAVNAVRTAVSGERVDTRELRVLLRRNPEIIDRIAPKMVRAREARQQLDLGVGVLPDPIEVARMAQISTRLLTALDKQILLSTAEDEGGGGGAGTSGGAAGTPVTGGSAAPVSPEAPSGDGVLRILGENLQGFFPNKSERVMRRATEQAEDMARRAARVQGRSG